MGNQSVRFTHDGVRYADRLYMIAWDYNSQIAYSADEDYNIRLHCRRLTRSSRLRLERMAKRGYGSVRTGRNPDGTVFQTGVVYRSPWSFIRRILKAEWMITKPRWSKVRSVLLWVLMSPLIAYVILHDLLVMYRQWRRQMGGDELIMMLLSDRSHPMCRCALVEVDNAEG